MHQLNKIDKTHASQRRSTALAAFLAYALAQPTAQAADATAPTAPASLETIIVTAQKRSETLQSAPLSVSALATDDLRARQIESISDVASISPGVSVGQQYGQNRTFIRGIGLTSFSLGADASTAFHVDGVYIGRPSAQLSSFFDLKRIEVVRGPQGTLYGRNATAGSINIVTNKPTDDLQANADLSLGNYNLVQFEGAVSGPLTNEGKLRGRLAVQTVNHDGYGKNEFNGKTIDDAKTQAVRGTVDYVFSEATTLTVTGDYEKEDDSNYAAHFFGAFRNDVPLTGVLFGGKTPRDVRNIASDAPVVNDRTNKGLTATVNWNGGEWGLNSITGYRDFDRINKHDIDGTSANAGGALAWTESSKQFSQEFQLPYTGKRVNGIVGAYYYNEDIKGRTFIDLDALAPRATFDENGSMKTDAYALFAQGTYKLTDQLRLTAGARYSRETRDAGGTFSIFGQTFPTKGKETWSATTPKVGIEFTTASDLLLYASATKGFKSGLFNIGSLNPPINPEYVWAYELGAKTRFLDNRWEVSAAAFFYDYKNLQVGRVVNTQLVTVNAASAENKGFEFSLRGLVTDNLELYADASYLDAKFTKFDTVDAARPELGELNLSGNYLPNSAKSAVNAGGTYSIPMNGGAVLRVNVDGSWTGKVYFTEFNLNNLAQKAVARLNAAVTYTSANARWHVTAYGKNLTDETIIANNIIASGLWGYPLIGSLEPPRTCGIRVGFNFGR